MLTALKHLRGAGLIACTLLAVPALAAPEEIQVYLDEFADPGKFGLDIHTNYVTNADAGSTSRNMLRATPELSYGFNENWEGALYWLASTGPEQDGGQLGSDGYKVRLKWRPRAPTVGSSWSWAVNAEIGELAPRFYSDRTSGELKFIGVWKSGPWLVGANLNLDRSLRSDAQQGTSAEFDSKIAYKLTGANEYELQLGVENYSNLGTLKNIYTSDERVNMTFLVADFAVRGWDFNVGLGTVTGATQDKTLIKAIIGVPF